FAGTSVAAIASRAGVSAETVYQAFGSKPALLDALVRRAGLAEFVDALSARGPLAVDRAVAVDTVWALASSDLQQLLMRRRGWSRTAYTTWLAESLARILLPPG
ncbi:MAG TPA: helix-turn-helix domain-containing protein, partial [Gaiellales bacterium]|nr:helix-turn-helix domain-containing protein [Gaiellales bacterium]